VRKAPAQRLLEGPQGSGRPLFAWSARNGARLRFIQPGKSIQNTFVESFIGLAFGTSA
jgi:hypothetical protein